MKNSQSDLTADPRLTDLIESKKGFFKNKPGARYLFLAGLMFFLMHLPIFITATLNDLWAPMQDRISLLQDYGWWGMNLTAVPGTILFFFWMPTGIQKVFYGLLNNRVIGKSKSPDSGMDGDHPLGTFLDRFYRVYSNKALLIICFLIVIPYSFLVLAPANEVYIIWQTTGFFIYWYTNFFWYMVVSLEVILALRLLICIYFFNRLFKEFHIDVRVLHPDGAGGLSPLGKFSVAIGYLIAVYGLSVVVAYLVESYVRTTEWSGIMISVPTIIITTLYLLLSPIAFFAPIGTARRSMKEAKDQFILKISNQYESEIDRIQQLLDSDSEVIEEKISKLVSLQELYTITIKFPIWPLNSENIVRFTSSILSPLFFGILSIVLEKLL